MRTLPTLALAALLGACHAPPRANAPPPPSDAVFAEIQRRGAAEDAMGVDQHTSTHRFDDLADGGRIELQRDVDDPAGVAQIRAHMRHIAEAFAGGDFRIPGFVHDRAEVPGTRVMAARRGALRYEVENLPRGAALRIRTADPEALRAVHAFLAFQRSDHRAHGRAHEHR